MLPKQILAPTDLSVGAEQAVDYACELARTLDAQIHLLNVISIPVLGVPELGIGLTGSMIDELVGDNNLSRHRSARSVSSCAWNAP